MKHAWVMGLVLLVWPIGSVGLQRGIVLIEDAGGRQVSLYRESHALLIGVSKYTGGWPRLPGVKGDLAAVKIALEQHGFQVEEVNDPDQATLENAYGSFIRRYGLARNNRLLFYFAGHGHTVKPAYATDDPEDWMGYIVARDAPLPDVDFPGFLEKAISMQRFEELAKQIQAKHALFVFDSCFSGSIFDLTRAAPENISQKTTRPVRQFITAGSADQKVPDRSVFRHEFVAALEGAGDLTGDRYITGSELGIFLEDKVTNYSKGAQTPQYGKLRHRLLDKGDFVFALAKPSEPPPPLPPPPVLWEGNVQVNVNVPATVYINDERAGEATPEKPLNQPGVAVGRTAVRVEAKGYEAAPQSAQVKRGEWTVLIFELVPVEEKALLTVRSNVYGDTVYIDGQPMGSTRLDVELSPGPHTVRVEKDDYVAYEETVELVAGRAVVVRAKLRRKEPVATPQVAIQPRTGESWRDPVTGTDFVWIEGDCFEMGSPEGEKGQDDDERQHRVCVQGFWLGEHEVTVGEFGRFVEATGYRTEAERSGGCYYWDVEAKDVKKGKDKGWRWPGFEQGDGHPVVCVSWNDAQAYIDWLKGEAGGGYRLPTEAEWEYAARAKTQTARYWGEDPATDKACAYANVADEEYWSGDVHKCKDKYQYTAPVGQLRANDFGLYDMLGNVWEWTCSEYDAAYGGAEQKCAGKGSSDLRVIRGGSWTYTPQFVRSASRGRSTPDLRIDNVGFRLARTP